jgi:Ni/Fe-hydrogenase subunit HybB-like protein
MAKWKIHPLWYTEFIPILFFVSSIFAGLSMVIFEGSISHKVFGHQLDEEHRRSYNDILVGLAKICAVAMFAYCFLKLIILVHNKAWGLLNTGMGLWYLLEVVGLVLLPCILFIQGARHRNVLVIRIASVLTMLGIIINRLNYVFIAYKWYIPFSEKYYPTWIELVVTFCIIFTEIWVFRWVVNRMPVLQPSPEWAVKKRIEN